MHWFVLPIIMIGTALGVVVAVGVALATLPERTGVTHQYRNETAGPGPGDPGGK